MNVNSTQAKFEPNRIVISGINFDPDEAMQNFSKSKRKFREVHKSKKKFEIQKNKKPA